MADNRSTTDTSDEHDRADPPGAVSNQNGEEAEAAHGEGGGRPGSDPGAGSEAGAGSEPGAAGEGSQATGQRENAG
jgi:hypothetical protein